VKSFENQTTNNSGTFPTTTAVNASGPTAQDGTEYIKDVIDHIWGKDQAIMDAAGLTPDGVTESSAASQILEAIKIIAAPPVGTVFSYGATAEPTGYILANGQTMGQIGSGATKEGDLYRDLYDLYWNEVKNNAALYTTSSALTSDANTDWLNNITIAVPDYRAVVPMMKGTQTINTRTKGRLTNLGEIQEDVFQNHYHNLNVATGGVGGTLYPVISASFDGAGFTYSNGIASSAVTDPAARTAAYTEPNVIGVNYIVKI
jgi:hypothetical protein